jgi:hypothetical protein
MELLINGKFGFNKKLLSDIIRQSTKGGRLSMLSFPEEHSIILYALVSNDNFAKLSKKESIKDRIKFYEYPIKKKKDKYISITAEISLEHMLDMMNPDTLKEINNYRNECQKHNMTFDSDTQLVEYYMKTHRLNILRKCQIHDTGLTQLYMNVYIVTDTSCIQRAEVVK